MTCVTWSQGVVAPDKKTRRAAHLRNESHDGDIPKYEHESHARYDRSSRSESAALGPRGSLELRPIRKRLGGDIWIILGSIYRYMYVVRDAGLLLGSRSGLREYL